VDDEAPVRVSAISGSLRQASSKPILPFIGYLGVFHLAWTFVWVYGMYPLEKR
jgi:hypothetical protein